MKKTKTIIATILILSIGQAFANTTTAGNQVTATLANSCQIMAQTVSFGQIVLTSAGNPQSANSSMMLHCTKGTPYSVSLNTTYNNNDYLVKGSSGDWYRVLNGKGCVGSYCTGNTIAPDGNPYYYPVSYNPANNGWVYDTNTKTFYAEGGTMVGAMKGDKIAYHISLPGNDSVHWDMNNTYNAQGVGSTQTIPIKATAQTGIRGSLYPAPDNYSSTVSAVLNF